MVAESIEEAQFIEGAQWLDGEARFIEAELPIVVDAVLPIVVVDADGKHNNAPPHWRGFLLDHTYSASFSDAGHAAGPRWS